MKKINIIEVKEFKKKKKVRAKLKLPLIYGNLNFTLFSFIT